MAGVSFQILRRTFAVLLIVSGVIAVTAGNFSKANATSIPTCSAANHPAITQVLQNGASSQFYFFVTFTNTGPSACALVGAPQAQPVNGAGHSPVGSNSRYEAVLGFSKGTVVLHARFGQAVVLYRVNIVGDWAKSVCKPAPANGVVFRLTGVGSFYIPISRPGAMEVCSGLASTWVGPFYQPYLDQFKQTAYKFAITELQEYLDAWRIQGPVIASREFLVPSQQVGSNATNLYLTSGTARQGYPFTWVSQNRFTLLMNLDLHFEGGPGAWSVGANDRYVTYTWSTKEARFQMELDTGP